MFLKQSTAVSPQIGPFLDSTDGVTAETALTISQADVRLSKAHGGFASKTDAGAATHDENGYYSCPLDATDTGTLGALRLAVAESGACPVWEDFMVLPANVFDSFFSTDKLQVDAVELSSDSAAADNAELFFDNTGFAATNSQVGSVTTVVNPVVSSNLTAIDAAVLTSIWNKGVESQGGYTAQQIMSLLLSALAGVTSSGGLVLKTPDGVTTRITAVVNASNERTSMTLVPGSGA